MCQTRNRRAAAVRILLGLLILLRITDSPVYAVECRHHHYREWIGEKRLAMTLFSILFAKASRDQEVRVGDDGKYKESRLVDNESACFEGGLAGREVDTYESQLETLM